jgi:hypothetical protein
MANFSDFRDVIDAWPSRRELAREVGVSLHLVNKWYEKDSVRGIYFAAIIQASERCHGPGERVTAEVLVRLAARSHSRAGDGRAA